MIIVIILRISKKLVNLYLMSPRFYKQSVNKNELQRVENFQINLLPFFIIVCAFVLL